MNRNEGLIPLQSVPGDGPETVLAEYAGACRRRVWLIVAIAAGVAGVAAVWSFIQAPQYQASRTEWSAKRSRLPSERPFPRILSDPV